MLNESERAKLERFVNRDDEGTGYLQRAQILLLADDGETPEQIASELELQVTRVRQFLRAFKRQGLSLFPGYLLVQDPSFDADQSMVEVGRIVMVELVEKIMSHVPDLLNETSVTAVHESRKSMRRLRTAMRLFEPFFDDKGLSGYRKRFRKSMRRLAAARDSAVFVQKLEWFINENTDSTHYDESDLEDLARLLIHFRERLSQEEGKARRYLEKGAVDELLDEFDQFLKEGAHEATPSGLVPKASKARHLIPIVIYQKLADMRAFDEVVAGASPELLHRLRIRAKRLRYTIEFFGPVLGPSANDVLDVLGRMAINLGDLNDARVGLILLERISEKDLASPAGIYREFLDTELSRLSSLVRHDWGEIEDVLWRHALARSIAPL